MINSINENEEMRAFELLAPHLSHFFGEEIGISITNTERYLLVKNGEKAKIPAKTGDIFPAGCAADICMKQKKSINVILPKEIFGIPVKTMASPIIVDGRVEGAIVIGMSVETVDKVTELSSFLSNALQQMSENVCDMTTSFQKIAQSNSEIEENVHQACNMTKKTDEVLSFVESIAKQTNLLGLNAGIEAARAGAAGKGFTVVSSEIRKLSQSTKESVEKIDDILRTVQTSVNDIEKKITISNDLITSEAAGLEEITATIEELSTNAQNLKELAKTL